MSLIQSTSKPVHPLESGTGSGKALRIEVPTQDQDNWCWCAVTLGVRRFYAKSSIGEQCETARDVLGVATACQSPSALDSNVMHDLADALSHYGLLAGKALQRGLSFAEVVGQINAQRPIAAQTLFLKNGLGHVVVIRGYRNDGTTERVLIDDPRFGEEDIPLKQFTERYQGSGEWVLTCLTKSPSS